MPRTQNKHNGVEVSDKIILLSLMYKYLRYNWAECR